MISRARIAAVALALTGALALAGCGVAGGYGGYGGTTTSGSAPAAAPTAAGGPLVATGMATVGGKSETVLMTAQGRTLYYFDSDTTTTSACTGGCLTIWPPLLEGNGSLQAPSGVTGTLSVIAVTSGSQVSYNGHPLYTYSGDTQAGQATGDGVNHFHVATPSTPPNTNVNSGGYNPGY